MGHPDLSTGIVSPAKLPRKKQKSISSFFTAAPTKSSQDPLSQQTSHPSPPSIDDRASRQHDAISLAESTEQKSSKRSSTANEIDDDHNYGKRRRIGDADDDNHVLVRRSQVNHQRPEDDLSLINASARDRTSQYLFSSLARVVATSNDGPDQSVDEEVLKQRARIHESFVRKLGGADSLANLKRRVERDIDESQDQEGAVSDDEEAGRPQSKAQRGRKAPASRKDKYTPLERQVIDIKRAHPDTLLIVEVGYKFRFFGDDARIAAKELNIFCIPGKYRFDEHPSEAHLDRFASASVPVHRLHVHVRRLVSAGHKVGVVRQLETAALKAAGSNRNSAFERGLTNLYTQGTYIDDQEGLELSPAAETDVVPDSGHLLCLTETSQRGWGADEIVQIGFVAVQPATGDIIYDDFEDGWMRSELETRLLHIAPCEFLIVGEITKATEKLLEHLTTSRSHIFGDKARIETVDKPKTMAAQAHTHLTKFYADKLKATADDTDESANNTGALLDKVHKLSENVTICLSAMIKHLASYKLEHVFDLTNYFQSFSARSHMLVNGNTLNSLEIFRNQTDLTTYGSLFWAMDRTQTRFGQRLLRKWVARPLLDKTKLTDRLAAVTELKDNQHSNAVSKLRALLGRIKGDLERSLIRIYYKKCTRPELLAVLQTLQSIAQEYAHVSSAADSGFTSLLISESIASLPLIGIEAVDYLERISAEAGKANDKYNFFRDAHENDDITNHKVGIVAVEQDLEEFRAVAAEKLKQRRVEYVTVAGIDYLIELDNTALKNVPASWIKISGTKKCSRYHAPEVVALIRERDQHKEALANACDEAFSNMLAEIGGKYQTFRDCVQSLAQLDCLLSLADVASQPGYTRPELSDKPGVAIRGGRHPMVEQVLLTAFVPNDVELETDGTRALLVTGPNMGGKSSYVRSVALIAIMAQCGSYVPADSASLGLLDAVFTRMGAFDNMLKRESTFMVELSETSDILKQATPRSLVILDELGRGTSTHDGVAIAEAVLHHFVTQLKSFTLFITHYQTLARMTERYNGELKNVHMRFDEADTNDENHDITFLYEVGEGIAHRSYGLNVAKLAGLPKSLIEHAASRSKSLEEQEKGQRLAHLVQAMHHFARAGDRRMLEHLTVGIEQL